MRLAARYIVPALFLTVIVLAAVHAPGRPSLAYRALRHFHLIVATTPTPPIQGRYLALSDVSLVPVINAPRELLLRPGHAMLIDVFATWCPPCRDELAALSVAAPEIRRRGIDVAGIDQAESPAQVQAVARAYRITYPVYVDDGSSASWATAARVIPTTVVLDGNGIVRYVHVGPLNTAQLLAIATAT